MLKNINIGKKLVFTFVLIALISSIGSIVGLSVMMNMNSNYSKALKDYGFSQGDIGLFNTEFNGSCTIIRDIVFSTDTETMNTYQNQLTKSNVKADTYFANMKSGMLSDKEQEYYNDIKNNFSKYESVADQVVSLAMLNKKIEAQTLLTAQGEPRLR